MREAMGSIPSVSTRTYSNVYYSLLRFRINILQNHKLSILRPLVTISSKLIDHWKRSCKRTKANDMQGFQPRAVRMRSGCDTTTPCAQLKYLRSLVNNFDLELNCSCCKFCRIYGVKAAKAITAWASGCEARPWKPSVGQILAGDLAVLRSRCLSGLSPSVIQSLAMRPL